MKKTVKIIFPLLIIPIIYFFALHFDLIKHYIPPCSLRVALGVYCPGCGGTRSFFSLLKGDILHSFTYNPIVPIGFILLILFYIEYVLCILGIDKKVIPRNKQLLLLVSGLFTVFYILRNFIPLGLPL